jgi:hypothetical protein
MNRVIPETSRIEIKFVASDIYYYSLLNWLHLHSAGFTSPYTDRWVNNIYFDTHDLGSYIENLSGVSSRTKVRYRWYGESIYPSAGALEIKLKRNLFGWKQRFLTTDSPYEKGMDWRAFRDRLRELLPTEGKSWLDTRPCQVLINKYYRKYLISPDGGIRVTVDSNQEVWNQRNNSCPNFTHRAFIPSTVVVEFKFHRKDRELASQCIQGIPIRLSKHSKYMVGFKAILGI